MSDALAARVLEGEPRAIARAMTLVENGAPEAAALRRDLYPHTGRAWIVGVTGPPGAGKSTLVDALTRLLRAREQTVGIVAVDPTSPFTGGAVLGDRVRMQAHAGDAGVFIRSMATRGQLGGLAAATTEVIDVLDAAGRDVVLVETVGVGQDEVDIARAADATVVTLVPGSGDDVQALKAGVLEIADVFVVNKADHDGADRLAGSLDRMLGLRPSTPDAWVPPIMQVVATEGTGVPDVLDALERFRARPAGTRDRRRTRADLTLRSLVVRRCQERFEQVVPVGPRRDALLDALVDREADPYTAADRLLADAFGDDPALKRGGHR